MTDLRTVRGMRDLMGDEMRVSDYLVSTAVSVFKLFGYEPLDSPAVELWETLSAKGGEDVEAETFKFRDKGDRDVGLRFDLTVPLARIVASNPHLPKPFRRYAIGKVWRYDRPQAGRYREFMQADVDIVGSASPAADAEVVMVAIEFMERVFGRDFTVRINDRKVLRGLTETVGVPEKYSMECLRAIDKLEKIGVDEVMQELRTRGISESQAGDILQKITLRGRGEKVIQEMREVVGTSPVGAEGVAELEMMAQIFHDCGVEDLVEYDMSLARGLDYYTGPVFEVRYLKKPEIGSVAGGGRYDHLIERFDGPPTPATGISLGIARLIDAAMSAGLHERVRPVLDAFIAPIDESMMRHAFRIQRELVRAGLACEVDMMGRSLKKMLEVADTRRARYVIIVGPRDIQRGEVSLRDMQTKQTESVPLTGLSDRLRV
ncbi:MAG: histidine--tRNA ligase [Candidatus Thorarchaeota archaeon]